MKRFNMISKKEKNINSQSSSQINNSEKSSKSNRKNIIESKNDNEDEENKRNQINPTFILKHLDLEKIKENYFKGIYKDLVPPDAKIKNREINKIFISKLPINEFEGHSYKFTNKMGQDVIIRTTNHKSLISYIEGKEYISEVPCFWCMAKFDWKPVGLVERYAKHIDERENISHIFWTSISFCSFNCYIRFLSEEFKKNKNTKYENNHIQLMKLLFNLMYPGQDLPEPSPDKEILDTNGGFLSYENYIKNGYKYTSIPKIICIPAKIQYQEDY